jgi:hypothetical protein
MRGAGKESRVRPCWVLALGVALVFLPAMAKAQRLNPNERGAPPLTNVEDKDDIHKPDSKIWVLDFKFYDPRLITVDIPGRGRKICWYLRYQVINNTGEPRTFIPDFYIVTPDKPGAVYHDQVVPKVQNAVRQVEDPTGYLDIKNSVTIASKPIPPSRPNAAPIAVTGVAIWDDIDPEANRFSIFVSGLSNGWSLAEIPPDNKQVVRRKTLQLNFKRLGDRYYQQSGEIRFVPPIEWVYRATNVTVPPELTPAKRSIPPEKGQ